MSKTATARKEEKQEPIPFDPSSITSVEKPLIERVKTTHSNYARKGQEFGEALYDLQQALKSHKVQYRITLDGVEQTTGRFNAVLAYLGIARATGYFWIAKHRELLASKCPQSVVDQAITDSLEALDASNKEHVAAIRDAWLEAGAKANPTALEIRVLSSKATAATTQATKNGFEKLVDSFSKLFLQAYRQQDFTVAGVLQAFTTGARKAGVPTPEAERLLETVLDSIDKQIGFDSKTTARSMEQQS